MINQEYLQQWIEIKQEIDTLQSLVKLHLELYFRTEDIKHLRKINDDVNEIIRKTTTEQELYQKSFSQI